MQAPTPFVHEPATGVGEPPPRQLAAGDPVTVDVDVVGGPVRLAGDMTMTFTAPFFPDSDPLVPHADYTQTGGDDLDGTGLLIRRDLPLDTILRGTLTFQQPRLEVVTSFVGDPAWLGDLCTELNQLTAGPPDTPIYDRIEVAGLLFPDGYGSVAITLRLPGGWEPGRRAATLEAVGIDGREELAARLRSELLPPLRRMLRRCGTGEPTEVVLPYFNLAYAGSTDHPVPGRSTLDDELRALVYPDSATPLRSHSPWLDEYLYTGYAYHVLAARDPLPNLQKLTLLLLILNVSYARLALFAAAADTALVSDRYYTDVEFLARIERRLRSEYQSLITPTFSFDHHALKVRDAVLRSWDVPKLQARTDNLIAMVRHAVEIRMAHDQARRIDRLNLIVVALALLSIIPTVDAALAIVGFFSG